MVNPTGEIPEFSSKRIISGIFSSTVSWVLISVAGALATHEMAIRYGAGKYGIFVAALAFGSIVENFTDLGLFQVLQRDIARDRSNASYQIGLTLGLRLTLNVLFLPVATAIGFALYRNQSPSLRIGVLLVLLALPLAAVQQVVGAYYSASARLGTAAILGVTKQATFVILVAGSILEHFTVLFCIASSLAGSVVSTIVSVFLIRREIRLRLVVNLKKWRRMFAETASIGLTSIIGNFYLNADVLLLSVLTSSKQLGFYGVAYSVISVFLFAPALLSRAIVTKIVHTSDGELEITVNKVIAYYAIAGALLASLAIVGGASVIRLYAGSNFLGAVLPLQILSVGQIFMFMSSALSNISIARGFHRKLFLCGLIGLALNLVLNFTLIPHFGIRGSAAATTTCDVVISIIMTRVVRRDLKVTARIVRASWKPMTCAIFPCVILWHWYHSNRETTLSGFLLMSITGLSFFFLLFLLRGIPRDLIPILRDMIPKRRRR